MNESRSERSRHRPPRHLLRQMMVWRIEQGAADVGSFWAEAKKGTFEKIGPRSRVSNLLERGLDSFPVLRWLSVEARNESVVTGPRVPCPDDKADVLLVGPLDEGFSKRRGAV